MNGVKVNVVLSVEANEHVKKVKKEGNFKNKDDAIDFIILENKRKKK